MKAVILAGGLGTRLSEETDIRPKPMVEIGGKPILWHIMKIYSHYGFNEFVICLGYKGYMIKEYFANYFLHQSNITIDLKKNSIEIHDSQSEPWNVTLVDTGLNTMTGGRIKKIEKYTNGERFMLTYGDGLSNVNLFNLTNFHEKHGKYATLTAVQPEGRFGALNIDENSNVLEFKEKPKGDKSWINGGFFLLENEIFDYIEGDGTYWEREPLENLTNNNQLAAYKHAGFWKPMDMLKDKKELEKLWKSNKAPWKLWKD
ncbi:glucose-1-phosphate cytidylyltransferase [Methanobrevibacter cuticularis]|uniref:Glucose-1-phosphate cytidylyltransferase n=1 Tax=Methanobrevibacter cuticularis TaxID=47311 RepID=A0A166DXS7_9EURY|nr:glucose-1-phosphate cytidylyltransferase [Methanobrevibacter cuticularis]KZX16065.1 glucose-1-phosphate cytidylyltransferase [Methanobrevibacter cuticularis]